jgi:hypothetical protein
LLLMMMEDLFHHYSYCGIFSIIWVAGGSCYHMHVA